MRAWPFRSEASTAYPEENSSRIRVHDHEDVNTAYGSIYWLRAYCLLKIVNSIPAQDLRPLCFSMAFEEGSDVEKAQAAMNIASAVCLAIPPPAGQVGQALMSLGSFVAGLFGGGDGNALGKMLQSMMNAAVREMKCYMDHKFHELHQRNFSGENQMG